MFDAMLKSTLSQPVPPEGAAMLHSKVSSIFVMVSGECVAWEMKTRHPASWIDTCKLGLVIAAMRRLGHDDISIFALDQDKREVTADWYLDKNGNLAFVGVEIA
jgi:hypothetical protein